MLELVERDCCGVRCLVSWPVEDRAPRTCRFGARRRSSRSLSSSPPLLSLPLFASSRAASACAVSALSLLYSPLCARAACSPSSSTLRGPSAASALPHLAVLAVPSTELMPLSACRRPAVHRHQPARAQRARLVVGGPGPHDAPHARGADGRVARYAGCEGRGGGRRRHAGAGGTRRVALPRALLAHHLPAPRPLSLSR